MVRAEDFRDPHTCGARKSGTHKRAEVLVARCLQLAAGSKEPSAFRGRQGAEGRAGDFEFGGLFARPECAATVRFAGKKGTKFRRMNFQAIPRGLKHPRW
jgi:hypothetical protein